MTLKVVLETARGCLRGRVGVMCQKIVWLGEWPLCPANEMDWLFLETRAVPLRMACGFQRGSPILLDAWPSQAWYLRGQSICVQSLLKIQWPRVASCLVGFLTPCCSQWTVADRLIVLIRWWTVADWLIVLAVEVARNYSEEKKRCSRVQQTAPFPPPALWCENCLQLSIFCTNKLFVAGIVMVYSMFQRGPQIIHNLCLFQRG